MTPVLAVKQVPTWATEEPPLISTRTAGLRPDLRKSPHLGNEFTTQDTLITETLDLWQDHACRRARPMIFFDSAPVKEYNRPWHPENPVGRC
jgi:hypothetical protein